MHKLIKLAITVAALSVCALAQQGGGGGGGTLAFPATVSGTTTSGGIPYLSSTTVLSSSGLLPTGDFVLGGGAGGAPTATFSVVPPVNGGTGVASPTANAIAVAEGSSNYDFVTTSTAGLCLLSNGTGNDPSYQACPAGSTVFPLTISGTVTSGGIPYFSSATVETSSAQLASNALVVGGGAGGAPKTGNADFTYATHTLTGGASGILDLSAMAATAFKIPTVAGAAPTADGSIATNSTTHALNIGSNGSTLVEAIAASGATSTSTNCGSSNNVLTAISGAAAPTCTSLTSSYLPSDVVYNDAANTYTTGLQSFAAATMTLPSSAAYAPTTAGLFGYDSTNNRLVFGNGSTTSHVPWFTATPVNNECAEASSTLGLLAWTTCVYSFSGDGNFASNTSSTGAVTFALVNAGGHKWWGNNTGSTAAPGYEAITNGDLPTITIATGGTNATSASAGQVPNTSSSTAATWTASPNFGINGTTNGVLNLASSVASGAYISILNGGATSAYNFNLPTTAGTAGQVLTSQAGGSSAMTWTSPLSNPMTTLGDMLYGGASGAVTRLVGPTGPNGIAQTICETPSAGAATAETFCIPGVPVDTSNTATIPVTDDVSLIAPSTLTTLSGTNMLTNNYAFSVLNLNTSGITYTPSSGSIYPGAGSTQLIPPSWFGFVYTNNTNTYMPIMPTLGVFPNTSTNQALAFNSTTGVFSAVTYGTVSSVGLTTNSGSSSGIFAITGSPVTGSGTLNFNLSGTSGGVACFTSTTVLASSSALTANALTKGGGAGVCPTNTDLQESSNLLNNVTGTQSWTVAGGQDASANSVLGNITLRGANETGAGGSTSAGGGVLVAGGTNAATNAASQGGSVQVLPGLSTGGTQGLQGLDVQESVYVKGATVTQFNLQCESASMTVVDCAATPGSWLGIAELVNSNTAQIVTDGQFTVNASAAVTLGDTVCAGSTAGKVTDSGGSSSCTNTQGSTVGIVMATSGTWTLPDGTSITATTTKPLIQMNTATVGGGGGGGANTALSNLSAVAVNTALLPGTTNSIALGSASFVWSNTFTTLLTTGTAPTVNTPGTGWYMFGTEGTEPSSVASGTTGFVMDSTSHCPVVWDNASNVGCALSASNTVTVTNKSIAASEINSGTLAIAQGGTNAGTAAAALINLFPTASEVGDLVYCSTYSSGCTAWSLLAGNTSGTKVLQETSSGVPSWVSASSSSALSAITAATGANTIANGNNGAQVWNWAQTTSSQTAFTFGETTAATGTSDLELAVTTLAGSTAVPLTVTDSLTGSQTIAALQIKPTWNTSGVVDAALLVNVTNTGSGAASKLLDLQVGGTSEHSVDKAGNATFAGTVSLGTAPSCTFGTGFGICGTGGTAPSAVPATDAAFYVNSSGQASVMENNAITPQVITKTMNVNVTPVNVAANVTTDQNLMAFTIPANTLNIVGRSVRLWGAGVYSTAAGSTAALTFKAKLCTVSGCGSGTVVTLATWTTAALPTVTAASFPWNISLNSSTQTASTSSAYEAHGNLVIDIGTTLSASDSIYADENSSTAGTIDSTGIIYLQVTVAASAGSTSNSFTQRQMTLEVLN